MNGTGTLRRDFLLGSLLAALPAGRGLAWQGSDVAKAGGSQAPAERDGQRDFDFEIGTWKTRVSRLVRPLSGFREWAEYEGTSVVSALMGGRANIVELDVRGPAGRIEGVSLRLYLPRSRQWSLNYASAATGSLSPPTIGAFRGGRGEFLGQETLEGRAIVVRFVVSDITPGSCRFEQAFSGDGGKTWEVNWVATDTRVGEKAEGEC